jgi:hypothetical protein
VRSVYSGCALINNRLAVMPYLRGKILRLTQKVLWSEQSSGMHCIVHTSEEFSLSFVALVLADSCTHLSVRHGDVIGFIAIVYCFDPVLILFLTFMFF